MTHRPTAVTKAKRPTGRGPLILVATLAILVQGCAGAVRLSAAGDIHAFLMSVRDDDRVAFDAHVDRGALKAQLRGRLVAEAEQRGGDLGALAAVVGRPLADLAVDGLVQPEVFRAAAQTLGYSADRPIPNTLVIAQALKTIDDDHVCVMTRRNGPCTFVFTNEDGVWRLTAFDGDRSLLRPPKGL